MTAALQVTVHWAAGVQLQSGALQLSGAGCSGTSSCQVCCLPAARDSSSIQSIYALLVHSRWLLVRRAPPHCKTPPFNYRLLGSRQLQTAFKQLLGMPLSSNGRRFAQTSI